MIKQQGRSGGLPFYRDEPFEGKPGGLLGEQIEMKKNLEHRKVTEKERGKRCPFAREREGKKLGT